MVSSRERSLVIAIALCSFALSSSAQLSPTAPALTGVEVLADGYNLLGRNFGTDPSRIQVYEGRTLLPANAIVSVAADRINVRSTTRGSIDHQVLVGGVATNVLTVDHPDAALASIGLNPSTLASRQATTITVALTAPAPAGGAVVALSATGAGLPIPPSITIPAGQISGTARVNADTVTAPAQLQVSASYARVSKSASIQINPLPDVSALSLSPTGIYSGGTSTATVTLTYPAPSGGTSVTLSSSIAQAIVPATLVVPAGATTAQFTVTGGPATTTVISNISANIGTGAAKTAQLFVGPAPITLTSLVVNPTSVQGGKLSLGTVTISSPAPSGGTIVTITSSRSEAKVTGALVVAGATSGSFNIVTENPAADVSATITAKLDTTEKTAPLTIISTIPTVSSLTLTPPSGPPGTMTRVDIGLTGPTPPAGVTVNLASSNADAPIAATVSVAGGASAQQVFVMTNSASTGGTASITAAVGSTASRSATLTITAPTEAPISLVSFTVAPATVTAGESATGTLTLSRAAPAGGATVSLMTSNPAAPLPASVTVPGGATSAQITIATPQPAWSQVDATLSAFLGQGYARTAQLTVKPTPITATSVSLNPNSVQGGGQSTGTVTIALPAPPGGATITLTSTNPAAVVPSTVSVPAGMTSAQFSVQTSAVAHLVSLSVSAQGTSTDKPAAALSVSPLQVISLTVNPSTIPINGTATGTVTIGAPAPPAFAVQIATTGGGVTAPLNVPIFNGATSATFEVRAGAPVLTTVSKLTASVGANPGIVAEVLVTPPPPYLVSIQRPGQPPTYAYKSTGIAMTFGGVTSDREVRIMSIRGNSSECRFMPWEPNVFPWMIQSKSQDGSPVDEVAAIPGMFVHTGSGPGASDVNCQFEVWYDWRWTGSSTWQSATATKPYTIRGHESVYVADTARLQTWLGPGLGSILSPPACGGGIKNYNGKLAFELTATNLGGDCMFDLMSPANGRYAADNQFNFLPEAVVIDKMVFRVEQQGSGCCVGYSLNQACTPQLSQVFPAQYAFDAPDATMDPAKYSGSFYAIFSRGPDMLTSNGQMRYGRSFDGKYHSALMLIFARLSCAPTSPVSEEHVTLGGAMCDGSCSILSSLGLTFVNSGTGIGGGGILSYVDGWQSQCHIVGGPFDGQCKADTGCPGGQNKFQENGVWKCGGTVTKATVMPWIRVILDSVSFLKPPGTTLPF